MIYHTKTDETFALQDMTFSVPPKSFTAIVGPSGCGKSTVLSLIAGLISPSEGEIRVMGEKVNGKTGDKVGYMLQHDHLFPWRDVMGNVTLGLEIKNKMTKERIEKLSAMIEQYGLKDFMHTSPRNLSCGMRQRVALIRTLALEPEILLLDEPFSALDYQTRINVSDDISKIIKSRKKTAILVTHDISEAISLADRVLILSRRPGRVKRSIDISLSATSEDVTDKRQAPEFGGYFNEIWKELNENAKEKGI
jgi:NitT/TauT family transport system ATP-binding protein